MLAPLGKWNSKTTWKATLILLESSIVHVGSFGKIDKRRGDVVGREGLSIPVSTASIEVDTCPRTGASPAICALNVRVQSRIDLRDHVDPLGKWSKATLILLESSKFHVGSFG